MRLRSGLRRRLGIAVASLVAIGSVFVGAVPANAAHTWSCVSSSANITDPNTNWHFSTKWTCESVYGAPLYADAMGPNVDSGYTQTATMQSTTTTWFVCYRHGTVHAGGNDIWYYTQGDVATAGMESRQKWGYMQASKVYTNTDPWPGMAQCPVGGSPVPRTDGAANVVLMIHGYEDPTGGPTPGFDCGNYWGAGKQAFQNSGWAPYNLKTVKYYKGDTNCDVDLGTNASRDTSIESMGNALARYIYNNYSRYGVSVDVVAHSMGGLIIRSAITGTQNAGSAPFNSYSWPPYLDVQDVATLGTPYEGSDWFSSEICVIIGAGNQCAEMTVNSPFLKTWITAHDNPQAYYLNGRGGTDWTFIGSWADETVTPQNSSLEWSNEDEIVGHKVMYLNPAGCSLVQSQPNCFGHMDLVYTWPGGPYSAYSCDYFNPCDQSPAYYLGHGDDIWVSDSWTYSANWPSPVEAAANADYYYRLH